ncbi:proton-conducting transporter membrane subunit [Pelagibacterium sp. H642]|uniref:proton-conducting transporter transmembrane domain-containing protein n=1 Tax=Pelagibacterium sp. H642 TaxID=1881069 RepID=UPI002814FF85|nr:proton-conducting transporter membrane subunit [Pelagibacterium sp. H642]WMT91252.1 Na+/H+ antiporter subunit D [Pelagibacterium sp. H642]
MATAGTSYDSLELPPAMIEVATSAADWVVVWPVALALFGAGFLVMLRGQRGIQFPFAVAVILAIMVSNLYLLVRIFETGPVAMTMGKWLPPFGITFAADMTSAVFALAASFAALIVAFYAQTELTERGHRFGFYPMLLLLLCGVSGSFLTGDIFNLYVWFEVMLIASFGMLILGGRRLQLDGAIKYGFLNFLATTFFLIAIAYLYGLTGTLNFADLVAKAADIPIGPLTAVALLFLFAFGVKAAAFPANAWLPASYHTPAVSVSAIFGGLLTKVGAYAAIRILVMVMPDGHANFQWLIAVVAFATLILGPLGALAQVNLRRAIGFLVIGGIGAIFAGFALGTMHGIGGAVFYAVHSMLAITAFYLLAGLIEQMTGTTDIRRMGGIYAANAPVSILFIAMVFIISGMPPFLGLWPKILLVEGGARADNWWLVFALLANSFLTLIAASRLWAHIFWRNGQEGERSEQPNPDLHPLEREETVFGLVPTMALMAVIVVLGLFPNWLFSASGIAARDMLTPERYVEAVFAEVPQP